MSLEELLKLKSELAQAYEREKGVGLSTKDSNSKKVIEEELNDIQKEQFKVDKLIEIYQNQSKNYIVLKLERLYMMLVSNLDEKRFNALSEDEMFEIFDKFFPDEWAYRLTVEQKEQLLLEAISANKMIDFQKVKKLQ